MQIIFLKYIILKHIIQCRVILYKLNFNNFKLIIFLIHKIIVFFINIKLLKKYSFSIRLYLNAYCFAKAKTINIVFDRKLEIRLSLDAYYFVKKFKSVYVKFLKRKVGFVKIISINDFKLNLF